MHKITIQNLAAKKATHHKISMLAVSDYPFAKLAEEAKIECILVGDSIGMTVYGYESLLPVTMEMMISHTKAVRNGAPNSFLIGDLPFLTYEVTNEDAIRNAGRYMAECGCNAVKLEGGRNRAEVIKSLINASIPVVGHIGFTPQAMTMLGGFVAPGQDAGTALHLIEDARILEEAGVCMLVLEAVPADVAEIIAKSTGIPVIGFGSGPAVDGQILLLHDLIGMFESFSAKFAKRYLDMSGQIKKAVGEFIKEVEDGSFPSSKNYLKMTPGEDIKLRQVLKKKDAGR